MNRRHVIKIATAIVGGVILLLAARTCQSEAADVTIELRRGDGPAIEVIGAELYRDGVQEPVARFKRRVDPNAAGVVASWTLQIDPGPYELALSIEPVKGVIVTERRAIVAEARARISIDLSTSLSP